MNSYHIVLYLKMELLQIALLLCKSTINKEVHHRRYAKLLNEILAVKPQPDLGDETILKNTVCKSSKKPYEKKSNTFVDVLLSKFWLCHFLSEPKNHLLTENTMNFRNQT